MEYTSTNAKELHKAIKSNIDTIKVLFQSAKKMQEAITTLQNEDDKKRMIQSFNSVVESINELMKNTDELFDLLEGLLDE